MFAFQTCLMFTPKIGCPNSLDVSPPSKNAKGFVDVSLVVLVCSEICVAGGSSSIGKLLVRFNAFGEEGADSRELEIRGCWWPAPRRKFGQLPASNFGGGSVRKKEGIGKYVSCLAFNESRCLLYTKLLHTLQKNIPCMIQIRQHD